MPQAAVTMAGMRGADATKVAVARAAILEAFNEQDLWRDDELIAKVAAGTGLHEKVVEFASYELLATRVLFYNEEDLLHR